MQSDCHLRQPKRSTGCQGSPAAFPPPHDRFVPASPARSPFNIHMTQFATHSDNHAQQTLPFSIDKAQTSQWQCGARPRFQQPASFSSSEHGQASAFHVQASAPHFDNSSLHKLSPQSTSKQQALTYCTNMTTSTSTNNKH